MSNLAIYEAVRAVPDAALREIKAGRLKGKSDINPMWRIKTLTEQFGACGFGWKYEIVDRWLENGSDSEIAAFVQINLFVKCDGEWSAAIPGFGGSAFVTKERNGPYTSDECYKMALTDAISVSCKALGVGADVYWSADNTKYNQSTQSEQPCEQPRERMLSKSQCEQLLERAGGDVGLLKEILAELGYKGGANTPASQFDVIANQIDERVVVRSA